jgi:hypothetical protein
MRVVAYLLGATVALLCIGCGSGHSQAENEFAEEAELARKHADERNAARSKALQVQRSLHPKLHAAAHPEPGCHIEYAAMDPDRGMMAVACGNLGSRWPLTVSRGFLRCDSSGRTGEKVVFTTPRGAEYALSVDAGILGYASIEPIRKRTAAHHKANLRPLAELGLELC